MLRHRKAGNKDVSIPAFSGRWLGTAQGVSFAGQGKRYPDPYAAENPLFTITVKNVTQYADDSHDHR